MLGVCMCVNVLYVIFRLNGMILGKVSMVIVCMVFVVVVRIC